MINIDALIEGLLVENEEMTKIASSLKRLEKIVKQTQLIAITQLDKGNCWVKELISGVQLVRAFFS